MIEQIVRNTMPFKHHLKDNVVGLEKEALRSNLTGTIAQTPHPQKLGSALTNPYITTDFSEALLEMVTPPVKGIEQALNFLQHLQYFVYNNMAEDEMLWHQSMPCVIRGDTYIPLAQYGDSNLGKMKTAYRRGLGLRYGRTMQAIAGIHFNYSFSKDFLKNYHQYQSPTTPFQTFSDERYMGLTRNVLRYGWLLTYLFGASPSVCHAFMKGYHHHPLVSFNENTLFQPYATSLRVGDIGYQNTQTGGLDFNVNYNSLSRYVSDLNNATHTPYKVYEKIGLKKDHKYLQLNTNILQIENEYYSNIRPKQTAAATESVSEALTQRGIEYVELRSLDINPLVPLGIDEAQMRFIEVFLTYCLLTDSPPISKAEQADINRNDKLIAHEGRRDDLMLCYENKPISRQQCIADLLNEMKQVLALFGEDYHSSFSNIAKRGDNAELTPSAQLLNTMRANNEGFVDYTRKNNAQAKQAILSQPIDEVMQAKLEKTASTSLAKQIDIEQNDELNFDDFLAAYFKQ